MRGWIVAISMLTLAMLLAFGALVVPSAGTASAQTPPKKQTVTPAEKKQTVQDKRKKVTQAERQAAAARAVAQGLKVPSIMAAAPMAAAAAMQDPMSAPYYFSVPNYANSPLPTVTTGTVVTVGNPLTARAYATDAPTPPGEVLVVIPTPLPAGLLQSFQTFNMATGGVSTPVSAGNTFHAYVLRPTAVASEYTVVFDSGLLTVPATLDPVGVVETFLVGNVSVSAGDVIAFYGQGIPLDLTGTDLVSFPATAAPPATGPFTLGGAG